jgi:DNA gyrase subunit A
MRYTEARLSRIGYALLNDIDKNTVDFVPNFDSTEREPTVLPAMIPILLANGATGIAVGMATNMAPHNLGELYDAINYIIDCTLEGNEPDIGEIINIVKAPDFPTGGQIIGLSGVKEAFLTGKGKIIIRAKYAVEEKDNKTSIVITEIPYMVNKASLIEKIHDLKQTEIPGIKEVRDDSDKDGISVVIELKRDANVQLVINKLLKHTEMQVTFSVNNTVLVDGQPRTVNLKECLELFMAHAASVVLRRSQYDLDKAGARLNIVDGIIRALDNIEDVIETIRNNDDAVAALIENYKFNEEQAKAIVDMRLKALTNASREKYDTERNDLESDIVKLSAILNDDSTLLTTMKTEFIGLKEKFADERRTEIVLDEDSIEEEDLVKDEMLVVTLSSDGLIKAVEEKEYRTQNRGTKGAKAMNTKDDEVIKYLLTVGSKEDLLFFTNLGRCHTLKAYKIAKTSRTARGKSINNYLTLQEEEKVVTMISTDKDNKDNHLLFVTKNGIIKRLAIEQLSSRLSVTKVVGFKEDDSLITAVVVKPKDQVMITTALGQSIRIKMDAEGPKCIRPMGRSAAGIIGISLEENDYVVDMSVVEDDSTIFTITQNGLGKRTSITEYPIHGRGGKGVITHKVTDRTGQVMSALTVSDKDEIFVATEKGLVIRINANTISTMGRSTSGVKIINLNEGDKVVSISKGNTEDEYATTQDVES